MSYSACPALALNGIVFCLFERFRVVWTGEHDSNTIRVDEKRRQIRCIQKYPDM